MDTEQLEEIRAEHNHECAVCHYAIEGRCSVAVLLDEVDRLHRRIREIVQAYDEGIIDRDDVIDDLRAVAK